MDEGLQSFNSVELDARSTPLQRVIQELQTPPFFATHKAVVVRQCPYFAPRRGKAKEVLEEAQEGEDEVREDLTQLQAAFGSFPPGVIALFEATGVNGRSSLSAAAKRHGALYDFTTAKKADALRDAQFIIRDELKRLGLTMQPAAMSSLMQLVGVDEKTPHVRLLLNELEKLAAYKGFAGTITPNDVTALVSRTAEAKVFDVTDALSQRNRERALFHLQELWQDGDEPLMVLSVVAKHFRQLLLAREMLDEGMIPDDVAQAIGGHPYVAGKLVAASRSLKREHLDAIVDRCFAIDRQSKLGQLDIAFALERLFLLEF